MQKLVYYLIRHFSLKNFFENFQIFLANFCFKKATDFPCKLLFQKNDINNRRKIIFLVAAKTQKFEPLPKED